MDFRVSEWGIQNLVGFSLNNIISMDGTEVNIGTLILASREKLGEVVHDEISEGFFSPNHLAHIIDKLSDFVLSPSL